MPKDNAGNWKSFTPLLLLGLGIQPLTTAFAASTASYGSGFVIGSAPFSFASQFTKPFDAQENHLKLTLPAYLDVDPTKPCILTAGEAVVNFSAALDAGAYKLTSTVEDFQMEIDQEFVVECASVLKTPSAYTVFASSTSKLGLIEDTTSLEELTAAVPALEPLATTAANDSDLFTISISAPTVSSTSTASTVTIIVPLPLSSLPEKSVVSLTLPLPYKPTGCSVAAVASTSENDSVVQSTHVPPQSVVNLGNGELSNPTSAASKVASSHVQPSVTCTLTVNGVHTLPFLVGSESAEKAFQKEQEGSSSTIVVPKSGIRLLRFTLTGVNVVSSIPLIHQLLQTSSTLSVSLPSNADSTQTKVAFSAKALVSSKLIPSPPAFPLAFQTAFPEAASAPGMLTTVGFEFLPVLTHYTSSVCIEFAAKDVSLDSTAFYRSPAVYARKVPVTAEHYVAPFKCTLVSSRAPDTVFTTIPSSVAIGAISNAFGARKSFARACFSAATFTSYVNAKVSCSGPAIRVSNGSTNTSMDPFFAIYELRGSDPMNTFLTAGSIPGADIIRSIESTLPGGLDVSKVTVLPAPAAGTPAAAAAHSGVAGEAFLSQAREAVSFVQDNGSIGLRIDLAPVTLASQGTSWEESRILRVMLPAHFDKTGATCTVFTSSSAYDSASLTAQTDLVATLTTESTPIRTEPASSVTHKYTLLTVSSTKPADIDVTSLSIRCLGITHRKDINDGFAYSSADAAADLLGAASEWAPITMVSGETILTGSVRLPSLATGAAASTSSADFATLVNSELTAKPATKGTMTQQMTPIIAETDSTATANLPADGFVMNLSFAENNIFAAPLTAATLRVQCDINGSPQAASTFASLAATPTKITASVGTVKAANDRNSLRVIVSLSAAQAKTMTGSDAAARKLSIKLPYFSFGAGVDNASIPPTVFCTSFAVSTTAPNDFLLAGNRVSVPVSISSSLALSHAKAVNSNPSIKIGMTPVLENAQGYVSHDDGSFAASLDVEVSNLWFSDSADLQADVSVMTFRHQLQFDLPSGLSLSAATCRTAGGLPLTLRTTWADQLSKDSFSARRSRVSVSSPFSLAGERFLGKTVSTTLRFTCTGVSTSLISFSGATFATNHIALINGASKSYKTRAGSDIVQVSIAASAPAVPTLTTFAKIDVSHTTELEETELLLTIRSLQKDIHLGDILNVSFAANSQFSFDFGGSTMCAVTEADVAAAKTIRTVPVQEGFRASPPRLMLRILPIDEDEDFDTSEVPLPAGISFTVTCSNVCNANSLDLSTAKNLASVSQIVLTTSVAPSRVVAAVVSKSPDASSSTPSNLTVVLPTRARIGHAIRRVSLSTYAVEDSFGPIQVDVYPFNVDVSGRSMVRVDLTPFSVSTIRSLADTSACKAYSTQLNSNGPVLSENPSPTIEIMDTVLHNERELRGTASLVNNILTFHFTEPTHVDGLRLRCTEPFSIPNVARDEFRGSAVYYYANRASLNPQVPSADATLAATDLDMAALYSRPIPIGVDGHSEVFHTVNMVRNKPFSSEDLDKLRSVYLGRLLYYLPQSSLPVMIHSVKQVYKRIYVPSYMLHLRPRGSDSSSTQDSTFVVEEDPDSLYNVLSVTLGFSPSSASATSSSLIVSTLNNNMRSISETIENRFYVQVIQQLNAGVRTEPWYCYDNVLSRGESDVDCGFMSCKPCELTKKCVWNLDCMSNACDKETGKCVESSLRVADEYDDSYTYPSAQKEVIPTSSAVSSGVFFVLMIVSVVIGVFHF